MGATNEQSERLETLARIDELNLELLRLYAGMEVNAETIIKRIEALRETPTK